MYSTDIRIWLLHFPFSKISERPAGSVSIFSQQKIDSVEGIPCQALNGWTVCRFRGARGGAPTTR
jgi:hypothetical protein